jgi:hypothetical protein
MIAETGKGYFMLLLRRDLESSNKMISDPKKEYLAGVT